MFDFEQMVHWQIFNRPSAQAALAKAGFLRILHWKILRGSHEFPGPDGGTCINEAAIVAAGYPYRAVKSVEDCPATFSRPCAAYALALNDYIDDDKLRRKLLLPFVARLGGSADAPEVEQMRASLMVRRTMTDLLAPRLAQVKRHELAARCRAVETIADAAEAVMLIERIMGAGNGPFSSMMLIEGCEALVMAVTACVYGGEPADIAMKAAKFANAVAHDMARVAGPNDRERAAEGVYVKAAAILDAALKLGRQPQAVAANVVTERMRDARERARERVRA
jgi:hypothetical protein